MKKFLFCFMLFSLILIINSFCFGLEINSPYAVLIDASNGRVIFEKDAYTKTSPASTTKIMTAILTLEKTDLNEGAIASKNAINAVPSGGSHANIQAGESFTIEDLLKALLLVSGNDAANILAEHVGGSISEFANMMNDKAKEIGCKNTHFVNPNGLDDDNHYSCAYDLAIMYRYAYNNFPDFRRIISAKSFTLPTSDLYTKDDRRYMNNNRLLNDLAGTDGFLYYYPDCTGGKIGYTSKAKNCFVASAEQNGVDIIACVLGAEQAPDKSSYRYLDTISLFNYGFLRLKKMELTASGEVFATTKVSNSKNEDDILEAVINTPFTATVDTFFNIDNLTKTVNLNEALTAPIEKGQKVGTIVFGLYGQEIPVPLVANNAIEEKSSFNLLNIIADILIVLFRIIIIIAIILLIIRIFRGNKSKKRRLASVKRYNARFRR